MEEQPFESILLRLEQVDTALSKEDTFPLRSIRLTSSQRTVKIGRASKTVSKGLVPAADNGFFDSPVVSREHAEIDADLENGTLRLTDVGSLHGTSVNGETISRSITTVLKAGDVVRFGIHVARGPDVFFPTACKVDIVPTVTKSTVRKGSYQAPESIDGLSDDESEHDSPGTDDHSDAEEGAAGQHRGQTDGAILIDAAHSSVDADEPAMENIKGTVKNGVPAREAQTHTTVVDVSDYGEAESDHGDVDRGAISLTRGDSSDEDIKSVQSYGSEDDDMEEEEDEEYDDDIEEDDDDDICEVTKTVELVEDDEDDEDDGGQFLDEELNRYNGCVEKPILVSPGPADDTVSALGDSVPVHGLWTPPSASAEKPTVVDLADEEDAAVGQPEAQPEYETTAHAFANTLSGDVAAFAAANKCNISSILNPSPPPSSPVKTGPASTQVAVPGAYVESQSFEVPLDGMDSICPPIWDNAFATAAASVTDPATSVNHAKLQPSQLAPETFEMLASSVAAEAAAWGSRMDSASRTGELAPKAVEAGTTSGRLRSSRQSPLLMSGDNFLSSSPNEPLQLPLTDGMEEDEDDEDDDAAMVSAAVYNAHKKEKAKASRKRKAEEMLAVDVLPKPQDVITSAVELSSSSAPQDAPAAKKRATTAAMEAKKKAKGKVWAVAEKIGIAALGGAVVLGSLIYTAPSF